MYIHDALFQKVGDPITMGILFFLVSEADGDGNVYMSYADIGDALGYDKTKAFRCVQKLASINAVKTLTFNNRNDSETTVKRKHTGKYAINVCNISAYKKGEMLMKRNRNDSETKKGDKNQNVPRSTVTVEEVFFQDKGMDDAFRKWLAYKKERRQSYKPKGLAAAKTRLDRISEGDPCRAMEIVEFCIANNYAGLFAPQLQQQDDDRKQNALASKIRAILED